MAWEMPFSILQYVLCILHGFTSVLLCVCFLKFNNISNLQLIITSTTIYWDEGLIELYWNIPCYFLGKTNHKVIAFEQLYQWGFIHRTWKPTHDKAIQERGLQIINFIWDLMFISFGTLKKNPNLQSSQVFIWMLFYARQHSTQPLIHWCLQPSMQWLSNWGSLFIVASSWDMPFHQL